jgi:hypothetical protein
MLIPPRANVHIYHLYTIHVRGRHCHLMTEGDSDVLLVQVCEDLDDGRRSRSS